MDIQTIANSICILIGAIIMLVSIVKSQHLQGSLLFVSKLHQPYIRRYFKLHRGLMFFFLFGYVVVALALGFGFSFVSEAFISIIFVLGAVFVLIGIDVQSRLLAGMQATLQGILPICSRCKKIRTADKQGANQNVWKGIEDYISEKTPVSFSHGYCPDCYEREKEIIEQLKKNT